MGSTFSGGILLYLDTGLCDVLNIRAQILRAFYLRFLLFKTRSHLKYTCFYKWFSHFNNQNINKIISKRTKKYIPQCTGQVIFYSPANGETEALFFWSYSEGFYLDLNSEKISKLLLLRIHFFTYSAPGTGPSTTSFKTKLLFHELIFLSAIKSKLI